MLLEPVTLSRHASKRIVAAEGYSFARQQILIPLTLTELSKAVMSLPLGFSSGKDGFNLVGLLGLQAENNLLVSAKGLWLGPYVPALLRSYPFSFVDHAQNHRPVLCIDEASGLLSEDVGELIFTQEDKPSAPVAAIIEFLTQWTTSRIATTHCCALLQQYNLIVPWEISVPVNGSAQVVQGLYRIDEPALNALPAADLGRVRQVGGLFLAYCQLLSIQHLQLLGKLAERQSQELAQPPEPELQTQQEEIDLHVMTDTMTLSFENLEQLKE